MAKKFHYKVPASDWRRRLRPTSDEEYKRRFIQRTKKMLNGCIEWQGALINGYGAFTYKHSSLKAHQIAWVLFKGEEIPRGLCVCHTCDNPKCVNLDHLWLGTPKQNSEDMARKGRTASGFRNGKHAKPWATPRGERSGTHTHPEMFRGEMNGFSKLTEAQVIAIRIEYAAGATQQQLADKYGVNQTLIGFIVRGISWKHVGGPISKPVVRASRGRWSERAQFKERIRQSIDLWSALAEEEEQALKLQAKVKKKAEPRLLRRASPLTAEQVVDMRIAHSEGVSEKQLANQYAMSRSSISSILRGKRWADVGGPIKAYKPHRARQPWLTPEVKERLQKSIKFWKGLK